MADGVKWIHLAPPIELLVAMFFRPSCSTFLIFSTSSEVAPHPSEPRFSGRCQSRHRPLVPTFASQATTASSARAWPSGSGRDNGRLGRDLSHKRNWPWLARATERHDDLRYRVRCHCRAAGQECRLRTNWDGETRRRSAGAEGGASEILRSCCDFSGIAAATETGPAQL